ncbi:protein kinase domain-containing protein, partial [Haematococcus lacustris]
MNTWCKKHDATVLALPVNTRRLPELQDNDLIIVLEWAEAGDLSQVLKRQAQAATLFQPLQVMHLFSQKPGNIFVAHDGILKLGDLGLSRYFSSRTLQALTT